MRRLSPLLAMALISATGPALAEIDDAVHQKCLEARDYEGCIKAFNTKSDEQIEAERIAKEKKDAIKARTVSSFGFMRKTFEDMAASVVVVVKVFKDSPAERFGLKEGDVIEFINGEQTSQMTESEISKSFKNPVVELAVAPDLGSTSYPVVLEKYVWVMSEDDHKNLENKKYASLYNDSVYRKWNDGCGYGRSKYRLENKKLGCLTWSQYSAKKQAVAAEKAARAQRNAAMWGKALNALGNSMKETQRSIERQQMIDAINRPRTCYGSSSTTGYLGSYGGYSGSTYGSTTCY